MQGHLLREQAERRRLPIALEIGVEAPTSGVERGLGTEVGLWEESWLSLLSRTVVVVLGSYFFLAGDGSGGIWCIR